MKNHLPRIGPFTTSITLDELSTQMSLFMLKLQCSCKSKKEIQLGQTVTTNNQLDDVSQLGRKSQEVPTTPQRRNEKAIWSSTKHISTPDHKETLINLIEGKIVVDENWNPSKRSKRSKVHFHQYWFRNLTTIVCSSCLIKFRLSRTGIWKKSVLRVGTSSIWNFQLLREWLSLKVQNALYFKMSNH